jgi:hypothetical protein
VYAMRTFLCLSSAAVLFLALAAPASVAAQSPCTISANCTGHASAVQGNDATGCICTCMNQWYGAQCQFCPDGVDPAKECGVCLPGYSGFPFCAKTCTIKDDCDGHASAVTGNAQTGCQCNCTNQWTGGMCQVCPPGLDKNADCGKCEAGYSGYPFCAKSCTVAADCSGHAASVSGNAQTGCICNCENQWMGPQCEVCPPGVDPSNGCSQCLPGHVNFPFCALACTSAGNCSNHAVAVSGDSQTGCQCTCRNQWIGPQCEVCPPGVDPSSDCSACLPGYSGFPFCALTCTIAGNCSNHAYSVEGNGHTGCICGCSNQWTGGNCGYCPPNFDPSASCATCAPNYVDYPYCNYNGTGVQAGAAVRHHRAVDAHHHIQRPPRKVPRFPSRK